MLQNERKSTPLYKKIITAVLSIIVFAIQIALFYFAYISSISQVKIVYFIGEIIGFILCAFIINNEKNSSYKLTWVILILILPLFFAFIYFLNYTARHFPKKRQKKIDDYFIKELRFTNPNVESSDSNVNRMANFVYNMSKYPMYNNTDVVFFYDALLKHDDMISKIKEAKRFIFLEYFIISDGLLLDELIPILEEKGKAGVEIKIIYDDVGSMSTFSKKSLNRLLEIPNLKICIYQPLGLNINPAFNYRDHRKICVIDGIYAYCGGDNLADEYIHKKERFGFWRDNACRYEGDAVISFTAMFLTNWYMSSNEMISLKDYYTDHHLDIPDSYVIPFCDGPNNNYDLAYDIFKQMINMAKETLYISTPYLIIDEDMINAICIAKKSGVDVKILVPGIPDKKAVFQMTKAHYKNLLLCGVEIYEYTPGFNHAKNIIVDGKYAFCGTVNMDYRSMFLHYECGAVLVNSLEIDKMEADFIDAVSESKLVNYEVWKKRNPLGKFISFALRVLSPML